MKKLFLTFASAIFVLLINGCHSSKSLSGNSEILHKNKWYLSELQGQPIISTNDNFAHLLFSAGQPNTVSGSTGCNRLNGTYVLSATNFIHFSTPATTKMACPGNADAKFLEALSQVNNWSISNDQLLLNNGKMLVAKFNAVSMEMDKLSGTWDLNYISGQRITFDGLYPNKKPFIVFNFSQQMLSGNTSCNSFSSKYTNNGNSIKFADGIKSMMFCDGGGEQAFLNILKKTDKYEITSDNTLTFFANDIAMMRFTKRK